MKKLLILCMIVVAGAIGWSVLRANTGTPAADKSAAKTEKAFDKTAHSLEDPASLWLVVNKRRPLTIPAYIPSDLRVPAVPLRLGKNSAEMQLRAEAATALEELVAAAQTGAGLKLMLSSAYRSYNYQKNLYDFYVSKQGRATADTQSARPGHSEHQTGLAADIEPASRECEVEVCFADLPEGKWVAANAYKYGFIIRYQQHKDATTGYAFEPWHIRYVGKPLAAELHRTGNPTLEEYFELGAAPDYR